MWVQNLKFVVLGVESAITLGVGSDSLLLILASDRSMALHRPRRSYSRSWSQEQQSRMNKKVNSTLASGLQTLDISSKH